MQEPAAVERARVMLRYAKQCAAPLHQLVVCVTQPEGFELLAWFRESADSRTIDLRLLDDAIQEARQADDPWLVLKDFRLLGLGIERLQ